MAKEISTQLVQVYERKTKNGISFYLHYSINGEQVRENTHLRLTGDKESDKLTKKAVQMLQAERTAQLLSNRTGIATESSQSKIKVVDYLQKFADKQKKDTHFSIVQYSQILRIIGMVKDVDANIKLCNISVSFANKFVNRLNKEKLAESTKNLYLSRFNVLLNQAVKKDLISMNPFTKVEDKPKLKCKEKSYLTENELMQLMNVCVNNEREQEILDAFVFSAFSGLRYSDVVRLKKENIEQTKKGIRVKIETQKTKKYQSFILPSKCESIIKSKKTKANETIFKLPNLVGINYKLKSFAKRANIEKNISFHTARHTFATMLLTKGADLYSVSSLLGHSDISTTQIYAKIVDKKKDDTIALLNDIL